MFEDIFLPINIPYPEGRGIAWHSPESFPELEQAKLLIFRVADTERDFTDYPVCYALRDLIWNIAGENTVAHLGVYLDGDSGVGLGKLVDFLLKQYPEARLLIYGLRGEESGLIPVMNALKHLTFFLPSIKTRDLPILPEIISGQKFERIIFAGVQQYLVDADYQKLASYPKVDIWHLRDTDNEQIEVVTRHARMVWADYRILARGVTGSGYLPHAAGMDMSRWAAMFYYAGLSPVNRVMILSHARLETFVPVDSETLGIGIWHYFEGLKNKIKDYPLLPIQNLEKTEVYVHDYRTYLYHNPRTQRWWIEVPDSEEGTSLLPVSYRMVKAVSDGGNTDALLKFW